MPETDDAGQPVTRDPEPRDDDYVAHDGPPPDAPVPTIALAAVVGAGVCNIFRDLLPFAYAEVMEQSDGQGHYTLVYRNGEKGPQSEGYAGGRPAARDAAERDFLGILPVMDRAEETHDGP